MAQNPRSPEVDENVNLDWNPDTYESITLSKETACGHIYCVFWEEEHTFKRMQIEGGMSKSCMCGGAWMDSIARLLTYALRRSIWEGNTKDGVIKQLLGQRCPSYRANKEHILSCPDAIGKMVLEYAKSRGWIEE